jgi:methionyl aminopeptidase
MGLFERVIKVFRSTSEHELAPEAKPGRNEPCWCGSGKKYKKCHLPDEEKRVAAKACSANCGPT